MKNSGGKMKKVYKLKKRNFLISSLLVLGVFMITLGGLFSAKSIMSNLRNFFDENEKLGEKNISPNKIGDQNDGTYKLSLTVTGDAERKPQHVNVIVIVDRSGSMDDDVVTGVTYTPTNTNGGYNYNNNNPTLYGLVNGEYVPLYRYTYYGRYYFYAGDGNIQDNAI